jgi:hypothetical protein
MPGGRLSVTHYKLNRIIAGIATIYTSIIIAAVFFGPADPAPAPDVVEYTPGFEAEERVEETDEETETVADDPTPFTGVGGVPAEIPLVTGGVVDAETGEPLDGVSVVAEDDGAEVASDVTNSDGRFSLENVPETASLVVSLDDYHTVEEPLGEDDQYTIAMHTSVIAGRVVNVDGSPIQGATVASGEVFTRSVENGLFRLEGIEPDADLVVKAAGFETKRIPRDEFGRGFTLTPMSVQGVYASAETIADESRFGELLDTIDETEINAIVVDLKDRSGHVHYESQVSLAQEAGAVQPVFDAGKVLGQIQERGIYAIARIVVFEDPVLAAAQPDLAIQDSMTGGIWESWQGRAWANPYRSDVWDYNIALIQEAAELGFDEIQLSYVQFPDNGPINRADYGQVNLTNTRIQAVNDFLDLAYQTVSPTGAALSADIFAMALWEQTDSTTGQDLLAMAERLDYVSPLLFPAHFASGSLGVESPNDHPSWIVGRSLESGFDLLPSQFEARLRPWLQDFSYGPSMPFDEEAVREQLDAAHSRGVGGWMLWNEGSSYHTGALHPEE